MIRSKVSSVGASSSKSTKSKAPSVKGKSAIKAIVSKAPSTRKASASQAMVADIVALDTLLTVKQVSGIVKQGRINASAKNYPAIHALVGQTTARATLFESIAARVAIKSTNKGNAYMGAFNVKEVVKALISTPSQAIIDELNSVLDKRQKAWASAASAGSAVKEETQAIFLRQHAQAMVDAKRSVNVAMGAALTYVGAAHDKYVQHVKVAGEGSKQHSRVAILHYWLGVKDTATRKANSDFTIGE